MKPFAENLALALRALSLTSTELAARLETDKSVISRWLRGSVRPSAYNLGKLSKVVAGRVEGFRTLDWDRDTDSFAVLFGADTKVAPDLLPAAGPPLAVWRQVLGTSTVRAAAYEGYFKCTRPHPMAQGRFLFEHAMIRRDPVGTLSMTMGSPEARIAGWLMPLGGLVHSIGSDPTTGTMMFGIFNGVGASRVDVLDGLILIPGSDLGRAPTATAMICQRVANLEGDAEADDRTFESLRMLNPLAGADAVPDRIKDHLARDFGPSHLAQGGDWLLSMSLARTLSRGPDYDSMMGDPAAPA